VLAEREDGERPTTLAAGVLRQPFSGLVDSPLKGVSPSHERFALGGHPVTLGGQSVPLCTHGGLVSFKLFQATRKR